MPKPYVFLDDQIGGVARHYRAPISVIRAQSPDDVPGALAAIDSAIKDGKYVAGYAAYADGRGAASGVWGI